MRRVLTFRVLAVIAVLVFAGLSIFRLTMPSDAADLVTAVNMRKDPHVSKSNSGGDISWNKRTRLSRTTARRVDLMAHKNFPEFQLAEFKNYLGANNRSVESLVAVFLLTKDKSLLGELKKYTANAGAMLCLASDSSQSVAERKEFANLYCKLNPRQMQGYLIAATIALEDNNSGRPKDKDAFLDLIHNGMLADEFSFGFGDAIDNQRQALESIGTDRLDAEALLSSLNSKDDEILFRGGRSLALGSKIEIEGAETKDQKIQIVNKYLTVAESFKELSSYSLYNGPSQYFGIMYEILGNLSSNDKLGGELGTVGDLIKKLEIEFNQNIELVKKGNILENSSPEVVNQFLEIRIKEGPQAAQAWILSQSK
ncbi:MAG: hypothetical protein ABIQ96_07100 [Luteolibacter sp.]